MVFRFQGFPCKLAPDQMCSTGSVRLVVGLEVPCFGSY